MRTLIVDDEPGIRSLAGKILSRAGSVCEMAATAEEALERLTRERFDIVLLDIRLPGMNGLELAQHIQQQDPDVSLVMITGTTNVESVIAAMQAGAADFVTKPFGADALVRAYGRAADRRRIRLDAGRAAGLQQAIAERTLEVRLLLLSTPTATPEGLAHSFLAALRLRNEAAARHAERVATITRAIGGIRGLSATDLTLLECTAVLHDVGKCTLPDTVMLKQEPLSNDEIQVVRRYPEIGYEVLRDVPALAECAQGVLAQLEHYDGSGTPLGLRGEQIPLVARIIAVANAYDVMTHPRGHEQEQSSVEALQEIEACAATQFDPAVVRDLLSHFGLEPRLDEWNVEIGS
jgi:response regulator RpfG family c-di-GMP phosphodiesterase